MKKLLSAFILFNFLIMPAFAKKDSQLPELPSLPDFETVIAPDGLDAFAPSSAPSQVAPQKTQPAQATGSNQTTVVTPKTQSATTPKQTTTVKKVTPVIKSASSTTNQKSYIVPKGKKFKVRLNQTISSNTPKGTKISFTSLYPETSRYITIPASTVFYGKITDSHGPQLTGNGGLIVIQVTQIAYNGRNYNIDAKISVANEKNIYLNNIKGQRMYLRSFPKVIKPGSNYFKRMWKVTKNLARNENGVEIILTPFSLLAGTVVYAVNFVSSPVLALLYKGKSITIPSGSDFVIKLREDAVLRK